MAVSNALYSPYGAYELKSKYQRNFAFGTLSVLTFIVLLLGTIWAITNMGSDEVIYSAPTRITTVAELGPPPTVAKKPPQVQVNQPQVAMPKVGIPTPVADEEVLDDDVVLATREELAEIVAPDIAAVGSGDGDIIVDIQDDDYLPAPDEFVPVEIYPEMIKQAEPDYPRLAKQAGLEGTVHIQVLVDKEGNVREARVARSSGTASLDDAAVEAGKLCKFKPGIQNGQPVAVWVGFKYDFKLNNQ